jgi:cation-transporting ATPase E
MVKKRKKIEKVTLPPLEVDEHIGLSHEQVQERVTLGLVNTCEDNSSITVSQILRNNIFTLFNLINVVLLVILFMLQRSQECWFFMLAVIKSLIGNIQ